MRDGRQPDDLAGRQPDDLAGRQPDDLADLQPDGLADLLLDARDGLRKDVLLPHLQARAVLLCWSLQPWFPSSFFPPGPSYSVGGTGPAVGFFA
jgi:hypothetical protein